ncbi:MAG TPA: response regulator [Terriglobia bacterium]|nr:response regulator [Terriglobia bacterium]
MSVENNLPGYSGYSVLLVDDEPGIRDILALELEEAGLKAQEAQDGIDALIKLRASLPHAIISDLDMPRMSGIEFISVVRRRLPQIPVIVFSGSIPNEFPERARPDVWFEKGARQIPDLLKAVLNLVLKTPVHPSETSIQSAPGRTEQDDEGYFVLGCTECLRKFRIPSTPEDQTIQRTATCPHCEACVPYLIESSDPEYEADPRHATDSHQKRAPIAG